VAVGVRLWRKLVEGRVEETIRVFVSTLSAADKGEVRDHLSLVFLVAELPKEDERLFEVPDCWRDAALGVNESESEVVERQRLGAPVTELTQDLERCTMLLGCLVAIAFAPKLHPELIEPTRLAVPVDSLSFPLTNVSECTGSMRNDVCALLQSLLKAVLAEPRLELPGSALDRREGDRQALSNSVAPQEPESSRQRTSDKQEGQGSEQDDAESESRQHAGQEEPDSGERENATAQLLPID
jgi:hypothetical protein